MSVAQEGSLSHPRTMITEFLSPTHTHHAELRIDSVELLISLNDTISIIRESCRQTANLEATSYTIYTLILPNHSESQPCRSHPPTRLDYPAQSPRRTVPTVLANTHLISVIYRVYRNHQPVHGSEDEWPVMLDHHLIHPLFWPICL